jgi:hypothetical protein
MASRGARIAVLLVEAFGHSAETWNGGPLYCMTASLTLSQLLVVRDMWLDVPVLVFRNNYCKLIMSKADSRTLMSCGRSLCLHAVIISLYHRLDSLLAAADSRWRFYTIIEAFLGVMKIWTIYSWQIDVKSLLAKVRVLWGSY